MGELPEYLQKAFNEDQDMKHWKDLLRQAIIDHPEDELVLTRQLAIYTSVDVENDEETIALSERLLKLDTEKKYNEDAFHLLARTFVNKKETSKAIDYYRKAIEIDPFCYEYITELADIYYKKREFDEAIKVYALLDNEKIRNGKEDMLRFIGTCYYNKQEFDKAMDNYQKALEIYPEDDDGWLTDTIGQTYWQMKNYDEAMKWFKRLLEKIPDSADAHYGIGLCYQDTGDPYRALHHYFEAVKLKPDFPEAYNNIAFVEVNFEGQHKKGIEFLEKALEAEPDDNFKPTLYLNLKRVYHSMGEFEKAEYYKIKYIHSMGFDTYYEEDDDDGDEGDILK